MWLELLPSCDTQRGGGQGQGWGDLDGTVSPYPVTIDTELLPKPPSEVGARSSCEGSFC